MSGDTESRRSPWREAAYVTAISAALIVPGVTLLDHWLDHRLELTRHHNAVELDRNKLEHEIRKTYLDRAVDPHRTVEYRHSVLAFMEATLKHDGPMKEWAAAERQRLERYLTVRTELSRSIARVGELEAKLSDALSEADTRQSKLEKIDDQLIAAKEEVESLSQNLKLAQQAGIVASPTWKPTLDFGSPKHGDSAEMNDLNTETTSPESNQTKEGHCCVTCNGLLICATTVETECGSCKGTAATKERAAS